MKPPNDCYPGCQYIDLHLSPCIACERQAEIVAFVQNLADEAEGCGRSISAVADVIDQWAVGAKPRKVTP